MKSAAKKARAKLKAMAKEIRKTAPRLPAMKKPKTDVPPKPRKAKRLPVVISGQELDGMKAGLRDLVQCGALNDLAAACLIRGMMPNERDENAEKMFRVAAALTDDRTIRALALMFRANAIRATFPQHEYDDKRMRYEVAQAIALVQDAHTAATWTSDACLAEWAKTVLSDLQKRQKRLPPDPNAEPVDSDDGEDAQTLEEMEN